VTGAIVHEWLERTGGSENVFEALSEIFPSAARYCLWNDSGGRFTGVHESFLARTPLRGRKSLALPLMPLAWRMLPSIDADWVLCSSHAFAHHARFRGEAADAPKLVYAHTPARYVWVPELDGRGEGALARAASGVLRPIDRKRAQEPVAIAANSAFVADRISRAWERESTVIYPPVDVDYFTEAQDSDLTDSDLALLEVLPSEFVFGVSRLVPYKRLDHVIETGVAVKMAVVIAGEGPDEARLRALATASGADVRFIGKVSRAALAWLYRRAAVVVFAPIEDFGIVPVEAMASGAAVLVHAVGGASESVVDGSTGVLVARWTPEELRSAVDRAVGTDRAARVLRAREFSTERFVERIREWSAPYTGGA